MGRSTRQLFPCVVLLIASAVSCKREERSFRVPPPAAEASANAPWNNWVRPGPDTPGTPSTSRPLDVGRVLAEPYAKQFINNAQAQSDGQSLYYAFNCAGCHAHGGGGIGPPLMDNQWFYGSDPGQVYVSILEGRPGGMPSFRGRLVDYQIWELVAYVRSLSGQANPNAASGREDHMRTTIPPNSSSAERPTTVPAPTTGPATGEAIPKPTTREGGK